MSFLKDVHPDHVFHLKSGSTIKNLYELANELATMDEEVFRHHVNDEKNDFHNWILHIIRDDHLANVFSEIKDRRLMLAAVEKRIQELENPPKPLHKLPFHITAKEYLLGIVIGAVAMLMITRLL
ncbi:MAG: hypothetical protein QXT19_01410 [Candidatus Woesearchaeota archaeon]